MPSSYQFLIVTTEGPVRRIRLNRPEVHNAFNAALISELTEAFLECEALPVGEVRAVVLSGEGKSFCAGADVNWMRESLSHSKDENLADARAMADMLGVIDQCPAVVIARIHGAALGGGAGLAAVCDIVIASEETRFSFSEAKLGIAPAVISPFVLQKIGQGNARALFLTAERFGAERALQIGLAHRIVSSGDLDPAVDQMLSEVMSSSPHSVVAAKELIAIVPGLGARAATDYTVETIATLRTSDAGQEGLRAFLEKRKPGWAI